MLTRNIDIILKQVAFIFAIYYKSVIVPCLLCSNETIYVYICNRSNLYRKRDSAITMSLLIFFIDIYF